MFRDEGELALGRERQRYSIVLAVDPPPFRRTEIGNHDRHHFVLQDLGSICFSTQRVNDGAERQRESGGPDPFARVTTREVAHAQFGLQDVIPAIETKTTQR